jgi:hypothetical protein
VEHAEGGSGRWPSARRSALPRAREGFWPAVCGSHRIQTLRNGPQDWNTGRSLLDVMSAGHLEVAPLFAYGRVQSR